MAKPLSFKRYLTNEVIKEGNIPLVWNKKMVNTVPEEEEEVDNDEDATMDEPTEIGAEDAELGAEDELGMEDDLDAEAEPDMEDEEPEDPNRQGVIRVVDGAHLVYKRTDEEGTFEELWMYKIADSVDDELDIRRDILAGTDIPQGKTKSEDKSQVFVLWTSGNVQFLHVTGLPN